MTRNASLLAYALVALAIAASASSAGAAKGEDPQSVFVQVTWPGQMTRLTAAGLLELRDPRSGEVLKAVNIGKEEAVRVIDALLIAGISLTLDHYPAICEHLIEWDPDSVMIYSETTCDGGQVVVWVKAGTIEKQTTFNLPASQAIAGLMGWVERYQALVEVSLGDR